ncbi:selenocysteine-specific translation elongation factor [Helicobacter sp. MIT 21-1697]|uniref:selenocysteine-specific translation elongation factor n=1 Tax=Helicobacter sp. MIT 21-1697 TaxID=2993733 RepID=UPI00224B4359|nr:selenocysteine-specific translation elongation factor [Helicobacter sp. MIT 21-1697]MCX2717915.1 selenocysteine-specific translation elongation factor [Helicobacter sp. MIT 21-1697]
MSEEHNDIIVGLAGHIDHGKTTLIKALNGFDGDSLSEEKQRGITLDLSFSHLRLPTRNVAFIDVPGHNKLVKNMIAGAFGIDVLLLVIAANEGIMPQSLEHLRIADMLGISSCICVITKIDKLENPPLGLPRLESDITALFETCDMKLYDIIALSLCSSTTPLTNYDNLAQLERLKTSLDSIPKPQRIDFGLFLYYIDRSFSIKGAGCVVTGSVLSGQCCIGDKLYAYDIKQEVAVRGIQIHDKNATKATPSHRVALNLSGINHHQLKRGFLLSQKGYLRGFDSIDVGIFGTPAHNATYQLYLGSAKLNAKAHIISKPITSHAFGSKPLTLATLKCDELIFGVFSQHFILRNDEGAVLGGIILNPIIDPIKKHQRVQLLESLCNKRFDNAFSLLCAIHKKGFGLVSSTQRFCLSHTQSLQIASTLQDIFIDEKSLTLYPLSQIEYLKTHILEIFSHNKSALLSAQSLCVKIKWASLGLCQKALDELLNDKHIRYKNGLYLSQWCQIKDIKTYVQERLLEILTQAHYAPLAPYNIYEELDIDKKVGDDALKALTQAHKVVRITHNLFITSSALNEIVSLMREIIHTHSYVDVNLLRERTNLSRKYLIGYLEYLDKFDDIECNENKRSFKYHT